MTSITDDILTWSEKYLEPKNKHLGNVSVCPYARMARIKKTYRILECHEHDKFLEHLKTQKEQTDDSQGTIDKDSK